MENIYIDLRQENKWIRERLNNKDMISISDLMDEFENLLYELEEVQEEFKNFKSDVEDNYEPIKYSRQIGEE
jgi:predicted nuclease with TOPRIM domain